MLSTLTQLGLMTLLLWPRPSWPHSLHPKLNRRPLRIRVRLGFQNKRHKFEFHEAASNEWYSIESEHRKTYGNESWLKMTSESNFIFKVVISFTVQAIIEISIHKLPTFDTSKTKTEKKMNGMNRRIHPNAKWNKIQNQKAVQRVTISFLVTPWPLKISDKI